MPVSRCPASAPKVEKRFMHFVAQFWLRNFRVAGGEVYVRDRHAIRLQGTRRIMGEDYLYTVFNELWQPSDALEDAFSKHEGDAAAAFERLSVAGIPLTDDLRISLANFLALTVCRHPDVMSRGRRRAVEVGYFVADVHSYPDLASFNAAFRAKFRDDPPEGTYQGLRTKTADELLKEAQKIEALSPQDPELPVQYSVTAIPLVRERIIKMDMTLLDAPAGTFFVLGDTPLPDYELGQGFSVPLSSVLALHSRPARDPKVPSSGRRAATVIEVRTINQTQFDSAKSIVIGSDEPTLTAL